MQCKSLDIQAEVLAKQWLEGEKLEVVATILASPSSAALACYTYMELDRFHKGLDHAVKLADMLAIISMDNLLVTNSPQRKENV